MIRRKPLHVRHGLRPTHLERIAFLESPSEFGLTVSKSFRGRLGLCDRKFQVLEALFAQSDVPASVDQVECQGVCAITNDQFVTLNAVFVPQEFLCWLGRVGDGFRRQVRFDVRDRATVWKKVRVLLVMVLTPAEVDAAR